MDKANFVGDRIAFAIAETRAQARDAAGRLRQAQGCSSHNSPLATAFLPGKNYSRCLTGESPAGANAASRVANQPGRRPSSSARSLAATAPRIARPAT
jgi:hypothetical protein